MKKSKTKNFFLSRPKRLTPERKRYYEKIRERKIERYIQENRKKIDIRYLDNKIMKKIFITVIVFFISLFCFSQNLAPVNKKITKNYELVELSINDSSFLKIVDTIVLRSECKYVNQNKGGFFSVIFIQDNCKNLSYTIKMEFYNYPSIHTGAQGFIIFKNYYFIFYGNYPKDLFILTGNRKKFTTESYTIPNVQDFPYWKITYNSEEVTLDIIDCW